jgi:hypothetical protein
VVVVSECRTVHTCFTMANAVCTVSEDGACNNDKGGRLGLQQNMAGWFNIAGSTQCDTTSEDSADDILGLLARGRQLHVRGSNEGKSTPGGGLVV